MNFKFQLEKHLSCHMDRWPQANRDEQRARIAHALRTGQAWLWPEPEQGELFA